MNNRRTFLKNIGLVSSGFALEPYLNWDSSSIDTNKKINWSRVKKSFPIRKYPFIHLNSGSAGVMPFEVQKAVMQLMEDMNAMPPYEAWNKWQDIRKANLNALAQKLGVSNDEITILRNTTEGLNNIIFGLPLQKGDEFVLAQHDYPFVLNAVKQRAKRDGIVPKIIDIDLTNASDAEIVAAYTQKINKKTKVVLLTHLTHRRGRILPIKKITKKFKAANCKIILDAAHSFAHIPFEFSDFGVDFMATSLHKWMNAPHGTGLLYVKKEEIPNLWALQGSIKNQKDTIAKFECLGTRNFALEIGISAALVFQEKIGWERKYQRLQYLKKYWTTAVKDLEAIRFLTPLDASKSGAIATFNLKNKKGLLSILKKEFGIHAKSVGVPGWKGIRITPNIFTSEKDLDQLINAITEISKR